MSLPSRMRSARTLTGHEDSVYALAFSPDGAKLASGARDGTVILWDVSNATILDVVRPEVGSVSAVAFTPDGNLLVAAGPGGVTLWRPADGRLHVRLEEVGVESIAFSWDASQLLLGTSEGRLSAWDVERGRCVRTLDLSPGGVLSLALSPDGQTVAAASSEGSVTFLDAATWSFERTIALTALGRSIVYRWLFSPDGEACAGSLSVQLGGPIGQTFTPNRYEIVIWEPDIEEEPDLDRTLLGHLGWIGALDFSHHAPLLASGAYDESVRLWDWSSMRSSPKPASTRAPSMA